MIKLVQGVKHSSRVGQFLWAGIFIVLFVLSFRLSPNPSGHGTHTQLGLPPCPSVLMFGRPCPGCGMTTSFSYCTKGDFINGFKVHPFGPLLFVGWGITAILAGYGALRGFTLDTGSKSFQWVLTSFAILFFAYGAFRFYEGFPPNAAPITALRR